MFKNNDLLSFVSPLNFFLAESQVCWVLNLEKALVFGRWLWLNNNAVIDQLVRSIREGIRTLVFDMDLTSFGPYFKTVVRIFSRMDLTIGQ